MRGKWIVDTLGREQGLEPKHWQFLSHTRRSTHWIHPSCLFFGHVLHMAIPVQSVVNGNLQDVNSRGSRGGNIIVCQQEIAGSSLVGFRQCLALVWYDVTYHFRPWYCHISTFVYLGEWHGPLVLREKKEQHFNSKKIWGNCRHKLKEQSVRTWYILPEYS